MKYKHLSIEEREKIQELLWQKVSLRTIAKTIGRNVTSVSREIQRNKPPEVNRYGPRIAHQRALDGRRRRGRKKRLKNDRIRDYVVSKLKKRWSPEQISGRMKKDIGENISHEAIYQYIYSRVRKGSNLVKPDMEDLRPYLRRRRRIRQPIGARKFQRIFKPKGNSIEMRPDIVNTRARVGDWEGDTVESINHKPGINTLVERKVGMVFITKLNGKNSKATVNAISKRFNDIPHQFKHTITLDNGPENRSWEYIEKSTGLKTYFAHPYCFGERGTNENTNGLIRDYFPKKTDFSMITDDEIRFVEHELNSRPRKRLGWKTPLEAWSVALGS